MPAAFASAWMARDADALAALFAKDADFVNVVGLWWRDRAAIHKAHDYGLTKIFADSTLTPGVVTCRDLGDVAVVHCRFSLTGQTAPDRTKAGPRQTVMSFVMQRSATGWGCVSAHNTDVVPGAETQVVQAKQSGLSPADYRQTPGT